VFAILIVGAGCPNSSPKLYRVTGTVLWQGKPMEVGVINVIAVDGQTAPASAKIVNGKFEVRTSAGMKTMSIYNQRDLGFNKAMNQNVFTNDVPGEYNANSTLRFEVAPHDDNVYDVSLPQDPPPKSGVKPSSPSSSAPQQK
jgi:hypothetical protein